MRESTVKNYEELPLFLSAKLVSEVLGVSPSSAYELMHEKDFPALRIGNRLVVPKDHFREWVDRRLGKCTVNKKEGRYLTNNPESGSIFILAG